MKKPIPIADLKALILTGGRSSRMGFDKSQILVNGKTFLDSLILMVNQLDMDYRIACSPEQADRFNQFRILVDIDEFQGPLNVLAHCHRKYPGISWLVISVDQYLILPGDLKALISNRGSENEITLFNSTKLSPGIFFREFMELTASERQKIWHYQESADSGISTRFASINLSAFRMNKDLKALILQKIY